MASIIADLSDDIKKMKSLKEEIQQVKRELGSINVKVELDIKRDMEARLKALTGQYDALVQKVAQAEARIAESTSRINKSAETIIKAQEQITKSASGQADSSAQGASGGDSAATNAQAASVQAQAKAYDELKDAIEGYLGTMEGNARYIAETESAISNVKKNISLLRKEIDAKGGIANEAQLNNLAHYTEELERLKIQLQDARRDLKTDLRINVAGEGSLAQLRNQLLQMQRVWDGMVESVRNSPIGQEFAKSIDVLNKQVSELEQTMGRYQRNVGNYASGWNGLNMSIQQIGRELPSLAMGWNTFFLAISNNLPILTDEIKRAKDEYNALKAAGQQATPVWKQVASSLLSWQTALTVGITLLTLYGKEIANWVSGLFSAKKALSETFEASENFHNSVSKSLGSVMSTFENLSSQWSKLGNDIQSQNKFISENKEEFDKLGISVTNVADAENILSTNKDKFVSALLEKAKAAAAMDIAAGQYEKAIKKMMEADNAQTNLWDRVQASVSRFGLMQSGNYDAAQGVTAQQFTEERRKKYQQQSEDALKEAGKIVQKYAKFSEEEQKILEEIGIKSSEQMVANSVEAINASIALKQEALNKVTNRKDYARIEAEIKAEQAKLNAITGNTVKQDNEITSLQSRINQLMERQAQDRIRQQVDLENQVAQARIDAMADGAEKVSAQRELDNKKELEAIERQKEEYKKKVIQSQKEIFDAQEELKTKQNPNYKKRSFDSSSVSVDTSMFDIIYDFTQKKQVNDRIREQEQAMNRYLQEYGTFQQKRLAITEEYNQKIQKALSENNMGEALAFTQERNRLLSSLDKEKAFEGVEKAFGNISNLSSKAIDSLIDNLKKYKKEAIDTFDVSDIDRYEEALSRLEDAKLENKFSVFSNFIPDFYREQIKLEEEFNQAQETSIELGQKQAELEKEILEYIEKQTGKKFKKEDLYSTEGINGIAGLLSGKGGDSLSKFTEMKSSLDSVSAASDNAGQKMSALFNMKGGSGGGASTVAVIDTIVHGINDLVQGLNDMANEIKDTMEALGRNTDIDSGIGKFAEGMSMFAEASQGATDAWDSLKSGNIGGVFAGVTKSFTAWIKGFAGIHDKKNEKRIQQLQEQVDTLTDSYDKLGRAVEDAYSKDASGLIEDQNKLLEQQKLLIEQQIREEQDKKNTDDERIKEWQRQIEEINQTIEDNKEAAVNAIFGEDLQSAIENFADAYAEAWANGEDKAESAKDTVKKMMQQMVTESIKAAIQSSGAMEEIRNKLQQFYADNVLTGWEQDYIYNMAEELQKELDEQFGWADSLFGSDKAKEQQSASSGSYETITQDQASELKGRFTALNESSLRQEAIQQGISNIADDMRNIIAQSYLELQQISENTGEIIKPIKQMQLDIAEVKRNTSRI